MVSKEKRHFYNKKYYDRNRAEILRLLSGKCIICGYTGPALQIDHIYGGGNKERKRLKYSIRKYQNIIYRRILAGSKDYQLLCANCNIEKELKRRKCED